MKALFTICSLLSFSYANANNIVADCDAQGARIEVIQSENSDVNQASSYTVQLTLPSGQMTSKLVRQINFSTEEKQILFGFSYLALTNGNNTQGIFGAGAMAGNKISCSYVNLP